MGSLAIGRLPFVFGTHARIDLLERVREASMNIEVRDGIVRASGARLIDRMGRKMLPIGNDGFETAVASSVHVDKTMLVADVLESGYKVTLFCRPRRFGKTLNMTMLKAFFEIPPDGVSRARRRCARSA